MFRQFVRKVIFCFVVVTVALSALPTPVTAATAGGVTVDFQTIADFADSFFADKMSEHHVPGAYTNVPIKIVTIPIFLPFVR